MQRGHHKRAHQTNISRLKSDYQERMSKMNWARVRTRKQPRRWFCLLPEIPEIRWTKMPSGLRKNYEKTATRDQPRAPTAPISQPVLSPSRPFSFPMAG